MSCIEFLYCVFQFAMHIGTAHLFFPSSATINQEIIYGAILIRVYPPITMPVAWLDLVRDTGWLPASPQLKPLCCACFLPRRTTSPSVRLLRFRCVHPGALPVFPHDNSPANAAGGSNITPRLAKQPDTWPIGTIWEWLAAAAGACQHQPPLPPPPPNTIKPRARCEEIISRTLYVSV